MRIDSSVVAMQSERSYSAYAERKAASLITRGQDAVLLDFSDESKSLMEQMQENKAMLQENRKNQGERNAANILRTQTGNVSQTGTMQPADFKSLQIETLRRILEMLNRIRDKKHGIKPEHMLGSGGVRQSQSASASSFGLSASGGVSVQSGNSGGGRTAWKKITVESEFVSEVENTAFQAQGIVNTSDGRQLSFGVSVEMTRAFTANYEKLTQEDYVFTDPLVINLDSPAATVTDQKFMFDLDCDGKEEEISFAGKGSGFLALDKNKDGTINDGNELFGTKSGDGFKDLAAYDDDNDGWIDEDDEVFNSLKIWSKDEEGNNMLVSLKDADVGAIYLGKADTQFSLNDEENKTDAVIRSTGVYLKESGEVGTIQHVDLVI